MRKRACIRPCVYVAPGEFQIRLSFSPGATWIDPKAKPDQTAYVPLSRRQAKAIGRHLLAAAERKKK